MDKSTRLRFSGKKLLFISIVALMYASCSNDKSLPALSPKILSDSAVLSEFKIFWQYWYDSVQLYKDYKASDSLGKKIENTTFITLLRTGNYLPLKTNTSPDSPAYRLIRIPIDSTKSEIRKTIARQMQTFFENSQLEGKTLGSKKWQSPNGYEITAEGFKGGYVLVKCWFLKCAKCIEEMPRFDSLFEKYGKKNIIFLALAEDDPDSIRNFKSKTGYWFDIIPDQSTYIRSDLHIGVFPTYILVGPDGKILKVVNRIDAVEYLVKQIEPKLHDVAPPPGG